MPKIINLITSNWLLRIKRSFFNVRKTLNPSLDEITFYLRVNDPYSYLLLQALPTFLTDNPKRLKIEIILALPSNLNLEVKKQAVYALKDAKIIARNSDLFFPDESKTPSTENTILANSILLQNLDNDDYLSLCRNICDALWLAESNDLHNEGLIKLSEKHGTVSNVRATKLLAQATNRLQSKGHYSSGILHYGGEWYWGIDRLWHLEQRLNPNCKQEEISRPFYLQRNPLLPSGTILSKKHPFLASINIDFYFSFRSPYSYIALERLLSLSKECHLNINIKPVLPMVMRGFEVPKVKKMYIVHDSKREANRYKIPFGLIADPIGEGIEKCMALFYFAKEQGKEIQFVTSVSRGIWAEGIDISSDKALAKLVCRAKLNWSEAEYWLKRKDWLIQANNNREDLNQLGLWGVPSFQHKHLIFWGQDRLGAIIKSIQTSA